MPDIGYLALHVLLEDLHFTLDQVYSLAPVILAFADLLVQLTDGFVHLLELLAVHVLVVHAPLAVINAELFMLLLEAIDTRNKMAFHGRDDLFETVHLRLNHAVHIVDMLQGCLLQVKQPLLRLAHLLLNNALTAKHVALHLIQRLVLSADLIRDHCCGVRKAHIILFFRTLDDLIHSVETVLDLLHEAALSLQVLPFVVLHLVKQADKFLLKCILGVPEVSLPVTDFIRHLALNVVEHLADHVFGVLGHCSSILDKPGFLFVKARHYLHLGLALLLHPVEHVLLQLAHSVVDLGLAALELRCRMLPFLHFLRKLVLQIGDLCGSIF